MRHRYLRGLLWALIGAGVLADMPIQADDETDACGAILCLVSGGGGGSECSSYLERYFSISGSKPWETVQKRANFLNQCPSGNADFNNAAAQYGESCQQAQLAQQLNQEASGLARRQQECLVAGDMNCDQFKPGADRAQQICGAWYGNEYITYAPPRLVSDCKGQGYRWPPVAQCVYSWVVDPEPQ